MGAEQSKQAKPDLPRNFNNPIAKPDLPGKPESPLGWGTKEMDFRLLEFSGVKLLLPHPVTLSDDLKEDLVAACKDVKSKAAPENREKDATLMNDMVLAAKGNDFDKVFDIIRDKKYLINGIPEPRAWSALHQAVFWGDVKAVMTFTHFDNCDVKIHAKRDHSKITMAGETPIELAEKRKQYKIQHILEENHDGAKTDAPTFVLLDVSQKNTHEEMPLFWLFTAFIPEEMREQLHMEKPKSFLQITEKCFDSTKNHLEAMKMSLGETLYPFCSKMCKEVESVKDFTTFLKKVINFYTRHHIYVNVNRALRRSSECLEPTGDDFLLCLYAFLLESILLHWDVLKKYTGTSYRGVSLDEKNRSEYKVGTKFMWMSFTSSSKGAPFKGDTKFIIDNQSSSPWSPREISVLSKYKHEQEVLYPAGATFEVTAVNEIGDCSEINLKLLQ